MYFSEGERSYYYNYLHYYYDCTQVYFGLQIKITALAIAALGLTAN